MKIEKLSLKGIENVLSREELKKISAGSGSGPCIPHGQTNCNNPGATCCPGLQCYTLTGTCTTF